MKRGQKGEKKKEGRKRENNGSAIMYLQQCVALLFARKLRRASIITMYNEGIRGGKRVLFGARIIPLIIDFALHL